MRVLVTGGGGYIGSVLVPSLLRAGHRVRLLDQFDWGVQAILHFANDPGLEIVADDVREADVVRAAMRDQDAVIHLAAVVGYPACDADPHRAVTTNVGGTRHVTAFLDQRPLVFASTCSVYGTVAHRCDENTPANPLSLYGSTKLEAESMVRDAGGVVLRFATLFGVAPRLRLDLLVNFFVQQAVLRQRLELYQSHFRRTFLHVQDAAQSCMMALEHFELMRGRTFNVADERTNMTKLELAERIQIQVPFDLRLARSGVDRDHRDYEVSSAKIGQLGFAPQLSLDDGIRDLVRVLRAMKP